MDAWDECIAKLEKAHIACLVAQHQSEECLDECHKMNEALLKAQGNIGELKDNLLGSAN